jgi:hypothetical protein
MQKPGSPVSKTGLYSFDWIAKKSHLMFKSFLWITEKLERLGTNDRMGWRPIERILPTKNENFSEKEF